MGFDKKEFSTFEYIIAGIFSIVLPLGIFAYLIFSKAQCDAIDKQFLKCTFTGSFFDWVAVLLVVFSGAYAGYMTLRPTYAASVGKPLKYYISWIALVAALFIITFL